MGNRIDAGLFGPGAWSKFQGYARNLNRVAAPAIAALASKLRAERVRRALATVDRGTLADLGISGAQAQFEASRPFWRSVSRPERHSS